MRRVGFLVVALWGATSMGCATQQPYDYSAYRAHLPRSILVLPPRNESVEVDATYSYLSTITLPLAEAGYYVFPVAVIDQLLKDNGLPTPDEMHMASLAKIGEIIGADAVLYLTIEEWGQKYQVLSSTTVVNARARLVDVASATTLWEGQAKAVEGSGGGGDVVAMLIIAAVEQIIESTSDRAHEVARQANAAMIFNPDQGLLYGPRNPKFETDVRGR
jgi:hypothetical protein